MACEACPTGSHRFASFGISVVDGFSFCLSLQLKVGKTFVGHEVECTGPVDGDQQKGSALRAWFCVPEGILPSTVLAMVSLRNGTRVSFRRNHKFSKKA